MVLGDGATVQGDVRRSSARESRPRTLGLSYRTLALPPRRPVAPHVIDV